MTPINSSSFMFDLNDVYYWGLPVGIMLLSFGVGLGIEKILSSHLSNVRKKNNNLWKLEVVILETIHGLPLVWCLLMGAYFTLFRFEMPAAVFAQTQRGLLILFLTSIVVIVGRIVGNLVSHMSRRLGTVLQSTSILANLIKLSVYAIGFLAILQTMGISVMPILTALGVGGLAVSLALNDTLSNFFAGLHILISQLVKPGEYIRLDSGQEGYVVDINLRNTTIRQRSNNLVIIPNAKLSAAIITNYDKGDGKMVLAIPLQVNKETPLEKVEQIVLEMARKVTEQVEGGHSHFQPYVRFEQYDNDHLKFSVFLEAHNYESQFLLKHEFLKQIEPALGVLKTAV